jgi:hypothetical protein
MNSKAPYLLVRARDTRAWPRRSSSSRRLGKPVRMSYKGHVLDLGLGLLALADVEEGADVVADLAIGAATAVMLSHSG